MNPSPAPRTTGWRRRLVAAFTEHLPLKGTALLLAIALWFIVSAKEPAEELVAVRFQPSMDSSLVLTEGPPAIRALVIGSGRELLKLYSSPPVIRRPILSDVPDTLEINLRPEDVDLPPGVEAIVRDVQPRRITMIFRPEMSKLVPVRSGLRLEADTLARDEPIVRFDPDSVRLSGPRRVVARINAVHTVSILVPAADSTAILAPIDTSELRGARVRPGSVFTQVVWRPIVRVAPQPTPGVPTPQPGARPDSTAARPLP